MQTTNDFFLDIARGLVPRHNFINKFGLNPDIDSGDTEDLWGGGGTYAEPATPEIVGVASSSSSDASNSTGAKTVFIEGLDHEYVEIQEVVTLAGTATVYTTQKYSFVYRTTVLTAGSGKTNAGIITLTSRAAGSPVVNSVQVGKGQSQLGIYMVPKGHTAFLYWFGGGTDGNAVSTIELFAKPFGGVYNLKGTIAMSANGTTEGTRPYTCPIVFNEKTIIKLTGTSGANNMKIYGNFDLLLIEN